MQSAYLASGARTNHRMAAPTMKIAPTIRPSLAVTVTVWKSSPAMVPGQNQLTPPATTKRMARALITGASISFW